MSGKLSWHRSGTLLNGSNRIRSLIISSSSLRESLVLCWTEDLCMPAELSNCSSTSVMPFVALHTLLIECMVLFGPILCAMLLLSPF